MPAALIKNVAELGADDGGVGGAQAQIETDGDLAEQLPQSPPGVERALHTHQSPPGGGREVAAGDSTDTADQSGTGATARMTADLQQYIIQESQTVYNNLKSFNGKRKFN